MERQLNNFAGPMARVLVDLREPIVIFAGGVNPVDPTLMDGYQLRVAAVDTALSGGDRVYVKIVSSGVQGGVIRTFAPGCHEVEIDPRIPSVVEELMAQAAGVYCHSIFTLMPDIARHLLSLRRGPLLLDLHGAVPEEADPADTDVLDTLERWAILEADVLVHVSRQMQRHIAAKHPWVVAEHVICPIFPAIRKEPDLRGERRNVAVYAGGTQPWQQVDRIVAHAAKGMSSYDIVILTPEPQVFVEAFAKLGVKPDDRRITIRSAKPTEVWEVYAHSRFGILCREDSVVNRVACPTKLIEYLRAGLLPLMGTLQVGDFQELGMSSIPIEAMDRGDLPQGEDLARMVAKNIAVVNKLTEMSEAGLKSVTRYLRGSEAT